MKKIDLREVDDELAGHIRALDGEPLVIADGDIPVAALVPLEGMDLESLYVSTNPDFVDLIERSRRRHREEGGISSEEMRRRLGIPTGPTVPRSRKGHARVPDGTEKRTGSA
jgi:antitoxin (DNA-binding transcriptional repressor) of toxin-antitoxin stability system